MQEQACTLPGSIIYANDPMVRASAQANHTKTTKELEEAKAGIEKEYDRLEALQEDLEKRRADLAAKVGACPGRCLRKVKSDTQEKQPSQEQANKLGIQLA